MSRAGCTDQTDQTAGTDTVCPVGLQHRFLCCGLCFAVQRTALIQCLAFHGMAAYRSRTGLVVENMIGLLHHIRRSLRTGQAVVGRRMAGSRERKSEIDSGEAVGRTIAGRRECNFETGLAEAVGHRMADFREYKSGTGLVEAAGHPEDMFGTALAGLAGRMMAALLEDNSGTGLAEAADIVILACGMCLP